MKRTHNSRGRTPRKTLLNLALALLIGGGVVVVAVIVYILLLFNWSLPTTATADAKLALQLGVGQLVTRFAALFLTGFLGFFAIREFSERLARHCQVKPFGRRRRSESGE